MLVMLLLHATAASPATLIAFAELPADTFRPGPTSGQFIEPANGREPPFLQQQPIQGFSALLRGENGTFIVLSDNGFGKRDNSSDYILSIYLVKPDFRTASGGSGVIHVSNVTELSDPSRFLPYAIARESDHLLTGADLDPESFHQAPDGSFWIGEELNPSLVHFNASGELLAPPYTIKGLASVDNPMGRPATLPRSRGFEGMGQSPDGHWLYPMLEGALLNHEPGLSIYTFDVRNQQFVNNDASNFSYRYRLDEDASAIGDFTLFSGTAGLVIERDSKQGKAAKLKRIYKIDFGQIDAEGFLVKTLVADLLNIKDPNDLNKDGDKQFTFPFWTIEGLVVISSTTLAIVNDNNYPLGPAREARGAEPDSTEFIKLEIDPLWP
jgi:hypothetical protein